MKKALVKRKAKLGIIGCGWINERWGHLRTIAELHEGGYLELTAVCDILEDRARAAGEKYHVPYYTDAEKMLSTDLDCVYITVGDYLHHSICKMVAEHGKHFTVEKPMAMSLPCCDIIINAAKKAGVHYDVAENYFRMPHDRVAKMAIKEGIIGDVTEVYSSNPSSPIQPLLADGRPSGYVDRLRPIGATDTTGTRSVKDFGSHSRAISQLDNGSHAMSLIKNFAGSNPSMVRGAIRKGEDGWVAWGSAWIDFENKVLGVHGECGHGGEGEIACKKIVGTKGSIFIYGAPADPAEFGGHMRIILSGEGGRVTDVPIIKTNRQIGGKSYLDSIVLETEPKITYHNPYPGCVSGEWGIGTAEEIMSIANAAVNDMLPEYGIEGRKDIEMVIAMIESGLTNKPIQLPITSLTSYEKRVHEAYEKQFGHSPLKV